MKLKRPTPRFERLLAYAMMAVLGTLGFWRTEHIIDDVDKSSAQADRLIEAERIRADLVICHARNKQLEEVNKKFADLNSLFDRSITQARAEGRELSPEILKLYEEYRQPIPLLNCDAVAKGVAK